MFAENCYVCAVINGLRLRTDGMPAINNPRQAKEACVFDRKSIATLSLIAEHVFCSMKASQWIWFFATILRISFVILGSHVFHTSEWVSDRLSGSLQTQNILGKLSCWTTVLLCRCLNATYVLRYNKYYFWIASIWNANRYYGGSRALSPFLNVLRGGDTEEVRSNHKAFLLNDI